MIQDVIQILADLESDQAVPKNVKGKIQEIISILKEEDEDVPVKVNRALNKLDEIYSCIFFYKYCWGLYNVLRNSYSFISKNFI